MGEDVRLTLPTRAPSPPVYRSVVRDVRLPSGQFNALVQLRRSPALNRWLGTRSLPSAKEMAIVSESVEPEPLRRCLGSIMHRLRRNKVLRPRHGLMLAAIDGHETHSSYKRCHAQSLRRKITVNGEKVIPYYNRFTVFQIIGEGFYFLLDLQAVLPGEDEVASAMRLLARVLADYPRCFDVLTCDAIYLRPSMIGMLLATNKHFVAMLKENQPELLDEARRLLPSAPPETFAIHKKPGKSARRVSLRQSRQLPHRLHRDPAAHRPRQRNRHPPRIGGRKTFGKTHRHALVLGHDHALFDVLRTRCPRVRAQPLAHRERGLQRTGLSLAFPPRLPPPRQLPTGALAGHVHCPRRLPLLPAQPAARAACGPYHHSPRRPDHLGSLHRALVAVPLPLNHTRLLPLT